jgi:hypothetical protein
LQGLVRMPRYYFHVRNDKAFDDDTGELHQTRQAAEAQAVQLASELAADGQTYRGYDVVVTDEEGNEIARLPIAPAHH